MKHYALLLTTALALIAGCGSDDDSDGSAVSRCLHVLDTEPHGSHPAPAFIIDPDPPEMIEHQPSGSGVDPAITREIRATFDERVAVEFRIDPSIDGTPHVTYDEMRCITVARWVFADTEQLRYATNYRIELWGSDVAGNKFEELITFTTKE